MPLHIGAPDIAFPRLNAFSYRLFVFGSLTAVVHSANRGRSPTEPTKEPQLEEDAQWV